VEDEKKERAMGFEPTVSTLGRSHVTTTPSPPMTFVLSQHTRCWGKSQGVGAPEWTRTTTPLRAQALNLLRIPFRHRGLLASGSLFPRWHFQVYNALLFLSSLRWPVFGEGALFASEKRGVLHCTQRSGNSQPWSCQGQMRQENCCPQRIRPS